MTSNIIIIYTSKIEYLLVLCVYIDIKMIFSHIIEEKNNIKIEILEEAKFIIEHDFQMMNPGSHVTSCFWWFVQALLTGCLLFSDKVRFWLFRLQKLDSFSWLKLR